MLLFIHRLSICIASNFNRYIRLLISKMILIPYAKAYQLQQGLLMCFLMSPSTI